MNTPTRLVHRQLRHIVTALFCLLFLAFSVTAQAQNTAIDDAKAKAAALIQQDKYVEALPILETIIAAEPKNAEIQFYLGFCLMASSAQTNDKAARKDLRMRARNAMIKARDLGKKENIVEALISSIPPDGGEPPAFSQVPASNAATEEGERAFTNGNVDGALALYKKAVELDPKNYSAALFAGDMYFRKEDFANAELWYQKAITIDPNIETAYRYSATPLMKQKKYDLARDRYIEAWIVEPYSRFAMQGIMQWADATNTTLGHPKITPPTVEPGADGKLKSTVNIDPLAVDGSIAWIAYVTTRDLWRKEKFAKSFPGEKAYRHTLQEEAEALRDVVKMAKTTKAKTPNEEIARIEKLDRDGLLEAYILLALTDDGIASDYPAYLKSNRPKLRQYVQTYVIKGGN